MRDGVWQVPEAERPQVIEPREYNPKIEKMFSLTGNAVPFFSKEERTVAHKNIMQARREAAANAAKKRLRERPHDKPQA